MISHLFTLSVVTDDFGQTAQLYMAHTVGHIQLYNDTKMAKLQRAKLMHWKPPSDNCT